MKQSKLNIQLNEKPFQIDYKENLALAFKMIEEVVMDMSQETERELQEELQTLDRMEQDLLHIIEFLNFNAVEGYNLSDMLKETRQARRRIKNRLEERTSVKNLIGNYKTKGFQEQLKTVLSNVEGLDKKQSNRKYRLRELENLEGFTKLIAKQKARLQNIAN